LGRARRARGPELPRLVDPALAAPREHPLVEGIPARPVIHVPQVRELVHHGVDQGRVLEGSAGTCVNQPHPDAAIVETDTIAVV